MTNLVAEVAVGLARGDSAERMFTRAVIDAKRNNDEYLLRWALTGLTTTQIGRGHLEAARQRLAEIASMEPDRRGGRLRMLEARMAEARGDARRAYRMYMEALGERGFPYGPTVPAWHRIVARAAHAALAAADPLAADSLARHALRLELGMVHDERRSVDIGTSLLLLARARLAQGDSAGARDAIQRAQRPIENGVGAGHPRMAEARALLDTLNRR